MVQSLRRSKSFRILFNSPELVEEQRSGFHHFLKHGIAEELSKISFLEVKRQNVDIEVFIDANSFQLIAPDDNSRNCVIKMKTYACKLYVQIRIVWKKKSGEILMQTEPEWVLLAHLPMMTKRGHFVINGSPRVIVHQIVRAPGVYFQKFGKVKKDERNKARFYGDIIPRKGVWVRLQISKTGQVEIKLKKSTKVQAEMVERCLAVIEKQELSKRQTFASTSSQFKRFFDSPSGQAELLLPGSTERQLELRSSSRKVRRLSTRRIKLSSRGTTKITATSLRKKKTVTFTPFLEQPLRTSGNSRKFAGQLLTGTPLQSEALQRLAELRTLLRWSRSEHSKSEQRNYVSANSVRYTVFRRNNFGSFPLQSEALQPKVLQQRGKSVSELSKQQQVDQSLGWIRKAFGLLREFATQPIGLRREHWSCFADFAAPSCSATQSTGSTRALENKEGYTASLASLLLRKSARSSAAGTQFRLQSEALQGSRSEHSNELACSERPSNQPNKFEQNYCSRSKFMAITGISKPFLEVGIARCRTRTSSPQSNQKLLLKNALSKQQLQSEALQPKMLLRLTGTSLRPRRGLRLAVAATQLKSVQTQGRTFVVRSRTTDVERGIERRVPKDLSEKFTKAELKGDDRAFTNVYDNLYRVPEMKELEDKMYPKGSSIPIDTEFKRDFSYKHIFATFKAPWRYSLGTVGRHKLNKKFGLDLLDNQLTSLDLQAARSWLYRLRDGKEIIDDIDHFQNRRVRQSGELIQNQFENGVTRLRKLVRRKLRTPTFESAIPAGLVIKRPSVVEWPQPTVAAIKPISSVQSSPPFGGDFIKPLSAVQSTETSLQSEALQRSIKRPFYLSRHSLASPFLSSKAEQEAERRFLSGDETCKTGAPESAGFFKLRRAVGASLSPSNRADLLLGRTARTRQPLFAGLQSEGVSEPFSDLSSAIFSEPIKKSSLFSRANLWKIRESLCFYTRDKGKRIPQWQLRINSRQTPFQYFIPRLRLTDRHGLLSKAWVQNRIDVKYNQADHAVGRLFPTKGGLWNSPSLDDVQATRTVLEKYERFSIWCTIERSVNKSAPVAGFAFLKPTYSSLLLAGLPNFPNVCSGHEVTQANVSKVSEALAEHSSAALGECTTLAFPAGTKDVATQRLESDNSASRECAKCTKEQLLLVFSKAKQEAEYGSKKTLTSRGSSIPTFDKLSSLLQSKSEQSSRYGKLSLQSFALQRSFGNRNSVPVGQEGPKAQALNPPSRGLRNSGAAIRLSITEPIRCHIVRRLRRSVLLGIEVTLPQLERISSSSKKGYILFSTPPITKSDTLHNQKPQKIEDFARLACSAKLSSRTSVHPKRKNKDATLEFFGDSSNNAQVVGAVVSKTPRLGVSKNESKPTRFAKSISLKRDSKRLQSLAEHALRRSITPKGSATQAKAISLNRIFKQASELFSTKPINGALREFFGINPLSQYMDQTNPLAELTHKRRISSLGIGGVSRESAGMAIRGIHPTHYGRICPIETPEGKNAGLVNSLALYARLNKHGFIETPYYKVIKGQVQEELGFSFYSALKETVDRLHLAPSDLQQSQANMLGQLSLRQPSRRAAELRSTTTGTFNCGAAKIGSESLLAAERSSTSAVTERQTRQWPSTSGRFMTTQAAAAELRSATATVAIHDPKDRRPQKGVQLALDFVEASAGCLVPVRVADTLLDVFKKVTPYEVDCIGISPVQILSVATSLIPFLEHNDANRALMGSNMQRQAVPLMISERPIVGTGLETLIAAESGQVIQSSISGLVSHVSANKIIIERLFNTGPKEELDRLNNLFLRTFPNRPISRKMNGRLLLSQVEHGSLELTFAQQKCAELDSASKSCRNILSPKRPFAKALLSFAETKPRKLSYLITSRRNDSLLGLQWTTPQIWLHSILSRTCVIKPSTDWTTRSASNPAVAEQSSAALWQSLASFRALISRRSMSKNTPSTVFRRRLPHEFLSPLAMLPLLTFASQTFGKLGGCLTVAERSSAAPLQSEALQLRSGNKRVGKKEVQQSESSRFNESKFVKASRALSALQSVFSSPTSKLQAYTHLAPSVTRSPRTFSRSLGLQSFALQPTTEGRPLSTELRLQSEALLAKRSFAQQSEALQASAGRASRKKKSVSPARYRSLCAQTLLRKSTWFCVSKYKKSKNRVLFSELNQLYKKKVQQSQHKLSVFGLLSAPDPVLLNLRLSVGLSCYVNFANVCSGHEVTQANVWLKRSLTAERSSASPQRGLKVGPFSGCPDSAEMELPNRNVVPAAERSSASEALQQRSRGEGLGAKLLLGSPGNRARALGNRVPRSRFAETSQQMTLFPFVHSLRSFSRSNQETCLTQKPLVQEGDWVQKGDILTDCSASEKGELAVGKNVMIAYLPWEGYNFEDAIVVSDRLTKEQIYASLHIERYVCEAQDIKEKITNSNEWFTRNLPGVNPKLVSHLDTFGFPKIGTILNEGDILVGKMRYFRNKPTTPYEKLLSDILGDGHFSVSLTSLRVPKGVHEARVISHRVVKTFRSSLESTFTGVSRPAGTPKMVNIFLGEKRSIQIGDKMSGRHGNKGIISTILPKQDMPYLPDGSPIDILLNPLGVPSRMNVGQIFESLLGLASTYLNQNFKITAFDELYGVEASQSLVYLKLYQARLQSGQNWLFQINFPGKTRLIDGRSGECFDQWVTVGRAYMLKLIHMVNEKIHARNTGPYALITQQPLRGRSQKGGQRLGEMEVWALEGYGAAYILQELLTKKSDDFAGRQEIINSLVVRSDKFSSPENPYRDYSNPDDPYQRFSDPDNPYQVIQETRLVLGHPEIFKTLICELQALCLDVGVYALKKESFQREYLGIVN